MNKDTGGPAFPQTLVDFGNGLEIADNYGMGGMTLRDHFAGQAVIAWIQVLGARSIQPGYTDIGCAEEAARLAGISADAMIAERGKA